MISCPECKEGELKEEREVGGVSDIGMPSRVRIQYSCLKCNYSCYQLIKVVNRENGEIPSTIPCSKCNRLFFEPEKDFECPGCGTVIEGKGV